MTEPAFQDRVFAPPTLALSAVLRDDGVVLRRQEDADLPFICALYASIRGPELACTDWSDDQKSAFCLMQSQFQQHHYATYYRGGEFAIIERRGEPIGRLYLFRSLTELRVVDIALMPAWRQRGIGGALMALIIEDAASGPGRAVVHVEKNNPALHLYTRLGFAITDDVGPYWRMDWVNSQDHP